MTNESIADDADVRRWAIRTLVLEGQRDNLDVAALLRFVTMSEYVLPTESADAVRIAANSSSVVADSLRRRGREQRLEAAVAEFASRFFELTYHKRVEQWQTLHDLCKGFPSLIGWLDHLSSGLEDVELPLSAGERVENFVKGCRDVFVARPADRIRQRQEFVAKCRERPDLWAPVARDLMMYNSVLVAKIAPWIEEVPRSGLPRQRVMPVLKNRRLKSAENDTSLVKSKPWWLIFAVILFFFRLLRFDTSNDHRSLQTPFPKSQGNPYQPLSGSRIPAPPNVDDSRRTPKSFDTILDDAIRSHMAKNNGSVPIDHTKPKSIDSIVNDAPRSRTAPSSVGGGLEFSFDTLPAEIVERMCDETTGLRESIDDPEIRRNIESFMTRLMPEVGDEIRLRYRQSHGRSRTNSNGSSTPVAPRWLSQLSFIAAATLKERSMRANVVDPPVSATTPENGADHP